MKNDSRTDNSGWKYIIWAIVFSVAFLIFIGITTTNIGNSRKSNIEPSNINSQEKESNEEQFSGTKTDTVNGAIEYTSSTVNDPNLDEGVTEVRTKGTNGTKTVTYKVTYENGNEISREKVSEEITKQPVNEVRPVGTKHTYTGSCSVKGTYRNRYASCTGDYSPQAKANAEAKAQECNVNTRAVQGCYNTYR